MQEMHEIGIVRQLLRTVTEFAEENSVRDIREVTVDCGELSLVIPEYLEELYPVVVKGSILENARLTIHMVPGLAECDACDEIFNVIENKGYMADACRTYPVGTVDDEAKRLMETAEKAFFEGIKYAKVGYRLRDVSKAVQKTVEDEGFGVIRDFVGHGIGTEMHEDPQIPNYVCPGPNPRLQKGMTLCIEPMITEGDWEVEVLEDDWTAVTIDGGWAAHYENTIVITDGEPEIITL